ncbi:trypsin-like peptidase domain-containing protein [Nostoc sp. FACHB-152]|uniref:trypsin-like serine peptidase n=1 Tax=unclassified Nostoc TaxID=2593658 RepID=UPI001681E639|nr:MULTISPECIES: serine protease [unclassified Nostoc]MBD2445700.1 trypsin-like peptidase domain-containing protein [Nostoc sp. FACHB-152]MBD2466814.1 trypsin-like peptidase domain-containing protein [Nostoc sp. FACHB-145]
MAKIVLNRIWPKFKIWTVLQDIKSDAQDIPLDESRVSGSLLANLINQRLHRLQQKISQPLTPVLNENDFLPFSFFETGLEAGKSVCCLVRRIDKPEDLDKLIEAAREDVKLQATTLKWYGIDPINEPDRFKTQAPNVYLPYASAFLVGGDYLLTNRHVVEDQDHIDLNEFRAVFNYEADRLGQKSDPELLAELDKYEFDTDFRVTSSKPELDYVLLKLKPLNGNFASKTFGQVNLAQDLTGEVAPRIIDILATDSDLKAAIEPNFLTLIENKNIDGDPIHMIQHPGGRPKEVVVFNNRLVNVYENFLEYDTDAEPGSSGSPVFNTEWQVVGIHQAAVLNNEGNVKGYLGIRMDCILEDLKQQNSNTRLQDFINTYLKGIIPSIKPQVFILAARKRNSVLGNDAALEQKAMENLRQSIIKEMKTASENVDVVSISGRTDESEALKLAVQDINQQRNLEQKGELAIELLVNSSDTSNKSKNFSIKLYYNAGNPRAQQLAQVLETVLQQDNPSFYIRAFPDSYTNTRGLMFCRKVNLPAVVIFVGDLANKSDRESLEKIQRDPSAADILGQSLTKGILKALEVLKNE